jgi:hypothetical protein
MLDGRLLGGVRARYENDSIPERVTTPSHMDFDKVELGGVVSWALGRHTALLAQYSHFFLVGETVDESTYHPIAERGLEAFDKPSPTGTYGGAADSVTLFFSAQL